MVSDLFMFVFLGGGQRGGWGGKGEEGMGGVHRLAIMLFLFSWCLDRCRPFQAYVYLFDLYWLCWSWYVLCLHAFVAAFGALGMLSSRSSCRPFAANSFACQ